MAFTPLCIYVYYIHEVNHRFFCYPKKRLIVTEIIIPLIALDWGGGGGPDVACRF